MHWLFHTDNHWLLGHGAWHLADIGLAVFMTLVMGLLTYGMLPDWLVGKPKRRRRSKFTEDWNS